MPIENRKAVCDICGFTEEEDQVGVGWPGWVLISGIGATAPKEGESISDKHTEIYACPDHKEPISYFINTLQEKHS